mgnify:CR=1 FL=1
MKTTIATGIAFLASMALYAYGTTSSAPPYDVSTVTAEKRDSSSALAAHPDSCGKIYLRYKAPTVPEPQSEGSVAICRAAFASYFSPKTRTPIWSAEQLSPGIIRAASNIERDSTFHEEASLPESYRSRLKDYRGSGWDRGHLAPSANMSNPETQQESFSLANIIPQSPGLNRGEWADVESDVRSLARRRDSVYVVTGILLSGAEVRTLPGGRVVIPDQIWKAVASPQEGTVVFLAENADDAPVYSITLDAFRKSTGIDPFPGATAFEATNMLRIR